MEARVGGAVPVLQLPPSSLSHPHLRDRDTLPLYLMPHRLQDSAAAHRGWLSPPPLPPPRHAHRRC